MKNKRKFSSTNKNLKYTYKIVPTFEPTYVLACPHCKQPISIESVHWLESKK